MSNIKKRGFGSMDKKKQRQIASNGGKTAHQLGVAHTFTHEEAVRAGKKGKKKQKAYGTTIHSI